MISGAACTFMTIPVVGLPGGTMSEQQPGGTTRRAFLTTMAAGSLVAASGRTDAQTETFRLGGEVQAWQGGQPSSIAGKSNPTLQLKPGQKYRVVWENLDGLPHNFVLLDDSGNALESSDIISQQGATQTVTFTATSEMAKYHCEVHPTTMVGQIQLPEGGQEATANGGISTDSYIFVAAIVLAVISPLLFAFLLMMVGTEDPVRPSG
jgi:plastocyanin